MWLGNINDVARNVTNAKTYLTYLAYRACACIGTTHPSIERIYTSLAHNFARVIQFCRHWGLLL